MLIERGDGVSRRGYRCLGDAKVLEKIVNRLALGIDDDGRPMIFKRLRGPLLMGDRGGRLSQRGH
jgi:hypothetical protein